MMFNKLERRNNHIPNPSPFPVVTGQGRNTGAHIGAPLRRVLRIKKLNVISASVRHDYQIISMYYVSLHNAAEHYPSFPSGGFR